MTSMKPIKPRPIFWLFTNFIILMAIMAVVILVFARLCNAQYDGETALAIVRCLRAECNSCTRPGEKAALVSVLRKRARAKGISLLEQTKGYCAVFNGHNSRARAILGSTFDAPKKGAGSRQWWRSTRIWVRLFLIGRIKDPEPDSWDWGSNEDTYRMKGRTLLRSFCNVGKTRCNHIWSK